MATQLSTGQDNFNAHSLQNRLSALGRKFHACSVKGESIKTIRNMGYRLCVPLTVC